MIMHFRKGHIIRSFEIDADGIGTFEDKAYFTNTEPKVPSINAAKRASRRIGLCQVRKVEKFPEQPTSN